MTTILQCRLRQLVLLLQFKCSPLLSSIHSLVHPVIHSFIDFSFIICPTIHTFHWFGQCRQFYLRPQRYPKVCYLAPDSGKCICQTAHLHATPWKMCASDKCICNIEIHEWNKNDSAVCPAEWGSQKKKSKSLWQEQQNVTLCNFFFQYYKLNFSLAEQVPVKILFVAKCVFKTIYPHTIQLLH